MIFRFDTGVGGLVLSDQFLQIASKLPSKNVFGFGEHVHDSFKHEFNKYWAAFSRDQPPNNVCFNSLFCHSLWDSKFMIPKINYLTKL